MNYITVPLEASQNREGFSCGKPMLDNYLQKQARQDMKRRLAICFVLTGKDEIKAYYTLSNNSIERRLLPASIVKKLPPSYVDLPATLLGRLAVNQLFQGQELGEAMLVDALKRAYFASMLVGSMAVIVDPLDDAAAKFYAKYEFISLPDSGKLFLPMETIAQLFPV